MFISNRIFDISDIYNPKEVGGYKPNDASISAVAADYDIIYLGSNDGLYALRNDAYIFTGPIYDIDGNGFIDFVDIQLFVDMMSSGVFNVLYNYNGEDNQLDMDDLRILISKWSDTSR